MNRSQQPSSIISKLSKLSATLILLAGSYSICHGGEVYKYTDENGNIIYSDTKPSTDIESESIKLPEPANQFDSQNSNQKTMQNLLNQQAERSNQERSKAQEKAQAQKVAYKVLEQAKQALTDARTVRAGDMFPLPGGGVRYSEQYRDRVAAAEKAVEDAQAAYNKTK